MGNGGTSDFGELLRRHRIAAALSQEELAEKAGLSARGVSDLERGARTAPRLETVRLLADALGLEDHERAALIAARGAVPTDRPATPRAADVARPPLPAPPTSFVGRAGEAAAVVALLARDDVRLVTLTGPGGVGKTRLALRAAHELAAGFADGAAFIDLTPLTEPDLVAPTVATALGVRAAGDRPIAERLVEALRDRDLLLVLDNFEQVVEAAPLVAGLLAACPRLTALVTSREPLRLSAEHVFSVPPLGVPEADAGAMVDATAHSDAFRLFVERARSARSDFAVTAANTPMIAEIVRHLDGLPLAIELAAARVATLPPRALLARLEHRLPLLADGPRDAEPRHRTMRDAIAWSNELLSAAEQTAFRRLAVFVDGCALEAIEAVLGPGADALAIVPSLVGKSLLRQEEGPDGEPRFRMLETIREFGLEQLGARGEEIAARDAHAAYILTLAKAVGA